MRILYTCLICLIQISFIHAEDKASQSSAGFLLKDGVVHIFPKKPKKASIAYKRIGNTAVYLSATRTNGKTRQVIIHSTGRAQVKFRYPFGSASATWNLPVKREGDIITANLGIRKTLIGDRMDPNEDEKATLATRKKLGLTEPDSKLPVMYTSGDSICFNYWPYLEGALFDKVNVYYQRELAKDTKIRMTNNGHAHLA